MTVIYSPGAGFVGDLGGAGGRIPGRPRGLSSGFQVSLDWSKWARSSRLAGTSGIWTAASPNSRASMSGRGACLSSSSSAARSRSREVPTPASGPRIREGRAGRPAGARRAAGGRHWGAGQRSRRRGAGCWRELGRARGGPLGYLPALYALPKPISSLTKTADYRNRRLPVNQGAGRRNRPIRRFLLSGLAPG